MTGCLILGDLKELAQVRNEIFFFLQRHSRSGVVLKLSRLQVRIPLESFFLEQDSLQFALHVATELCQFPLPLRMPYSAHDLCHG
jgi:Ser/Thr protein kinase RdoA (MazF antagonist)